MPEASAVLEWQGRTAVDPNGEKLGKIEAIYLDQETDRPEWALINTGLFGGTSSFMPLSGATSDGNTVTAPFSKDQVKEAPRLDPDGELTEAEESKLYAHYGVEYGGSEASVGRDLSGPETDEAMTRSEEELSVGTARRETGRARLVKHIVTEAVSTTVPVQREEIRVEREPITDANRDAATTGGDLTEEEHEVTLHEEEVVVDKRVVPKERVRLDKDVTTEEREVTDQIRKEQIDTEGSV